jgi:hypothetical protein
VVSNATQSPPQPPKSSCGVMKKCVNTGVFDSSTCGCKCTKPWTGEFCEKCEAKACMNGMVQDPNTCGCVCPTTKSCDHDGVLDTDTCTCNCTGAWTGPECKKCDIPPPGKDECNGHGAFSADQCECVCMPPWLPESKCKTCSLKEEKCMNGAFVASNCSCACTGLWTGEICDQCPTEEERLVKGVDCKGRAFNSKTCQCEQACEPRTCKNGGVQNQQTCKCECNIKDKNGEAPDKDQTSPANSNATAMFVEVWGSTENRTFWSGDDCGVCEIPDPSPCKGSRQFNTTTCSCDNSCPIVSCFNDGEYNEKACACDCVAGWGGPQCQQRATGKSQALAGKSCKTLQLTNKNTTSGMYWINPSGTDNGHNAFQVYCDMSNDGGGWTRLASVGDTLRQRQLDAASYRDGVNNGVPDTEYIKKCAAFNGMDKATSSNDPLRSFIARVSMGAVMDYFKPVDGASLCDMITSKSKHMWSPNGGLSDAGSAGSESESGSESTAFLEMFTSLTGRVRGSARRLGSLAARAQRAVEQLGDQAGSLVDAGMGADGSETSSDSIWMTPEYEDLPQLKNVLGGSKKKWPKDIDGRMYISFWGGNKGGCCHRSSNVYKGSVGAVDTGSWSQGFNMDIIEVSTADAEKKKPATKKATKSARFASVDDSEQ